MPVLPAATAIVLILAVLMGGATRQGYLGDVVAQVAACFLIGLSLWTFCEPGRQPRFDRLGKAVLAVAGLLCLVQVLPIFPWGGIKTLSIPDAAGGAVIVAQTWWSRISLTPAATWAGLTSAVVPVAIFMAVTQCDAAGRLLLWRVVLGLGGLALLLAVLQMLQGPASSLRFFRITNPTEAVGFFANRNHFAAQLYVTLAFAGVWIVSSGRQLMREGRLNNLSMLSIGGAIAFLLLITAGLAMARSRAGVLIAVGVVAGIGVMAVLAPKQGEGVEARGRSTRAILLALAFAVLLVVQLGLHQIIGRFETDVAEDLRWPLSLATFRAAWSALPFGTGIGSFVRVYGAIEDPTYLLTAYVNRAHNDLAEFLLETGLVGAALLGLVLIWLWRHAAAVWLKVPAGEGGDVLALQRAATLVIAGLLLHALVDYGLRTTALSALFAFACALLTPLPPAGRTTRSVAGGGRQGTSSGSPRAAPVLAPLPPAPIPRPTWGGDVEWPEEWRQTGGKPTDSHRRGQ